MSGPYNTAGRRQIGERTPASDCEETTEADYSIFENPITNINWRRHHRGCPHYRERWFPESDLGAGEPIYQVFCAKNTPPESVDEQDRCLSSKTRCWRLAAAVGEPGAGPSQHIPVSSVKRRRPA